MNPHPSIAENRQLLVITAASDRDLGRQIRDKLESCFEELRPGVVQVVSGGLSGEGLPLGHQAGDPAVVAPIVTHRYLGEWGQDLKVMERCSWLVPLVEARILEDPDNELVEAVRRQRPVIVKSLSDLNDLDCSSICWRILDVLDLSRAIRMLDEMKGAVMKAAGEPGFDADFRIGMTAKILQDAHTEVNLLCEQKSYEQPLSGSSKNFTVRATPLFNHAKEVFAISMDRTSSFWTDMEDKATALTYVKGQPPNTVRLFVFSAVDNALEYADVLNGHAAQGHYGGNENGKVIFTTLEAWRRAVEGIAKSGYEEQATRGRLTKDFATKDFAVLKYPNDKKYIAELTQKTEGEPAKLKVRPQNDEEQAMCAGIVDLLNKHREELEVDYQIYQWKKDFAPYVSPVDENPPVNSQKEAMPSALAEEKNLRLINSPKWIEQVASMFGQQDPATGTVYHLVFFSPSQLPSEDLKNYIRNIIGENFFNKEQDKYQERLVDSWWLGSVHLGEYREPKYKGRLVLDNDLVRKYPLCLIMKFRSVDDLRVYYENDNHAKERLGLHRTLGLGDLCTWLEGTHEGVPADKLYEAIEDVALRQMARADYVEKRRPDDVRPYPFREPKNPSGAS